MNTGNRVVAAAASQCILDWQHIQHAFFALRPISDTGFAGALAPYLPDDLLDKVVEHLLMKLRNDDLDGDTAQTYMHCIGAVR